MPFYTCVPQGAVEIVERFGKFDRVAYPGFNCLWPCLGEGIKGHLNMRINQLDVSVETKTHDNVFVHLVVSVQYQVLRDNIYDAFYKLTNSQKQITSFVFDVVRSSVPRMSLDDVFISKEEIATNIKTQLTKSMGSFGFAIIQTLVTDIVPAKKVKEAMNEINAATRLRAAAVEKAEAQKVTVVKAAEAEAEAKFLSGQGIARQRQAIVAGLRESVLQFSHEVPDITNEEIMNMMLMTQYFDALKDIGLHSSTGTIFLPHQPGTMQDISSQIRNGVPWIVKCEVLPNSFARFWAKFSMVSLLEFVW